VHYVLGTLLLGAAVSAMVLSRPGSHVVPALTARWHGRSMVVVDRGEGRFDVIGRSRRVGHNLDDVRLIALDGRTGAVRWESASIGSYISTDEGFVTQTGDLVLFTVERTIRGFALADGSLRWSAVLPARIERLCQPAGDTIIAIGVDGMERAIQKRDGTVMPGFERSPDAPTCASLLADARERRPDSSVVSDEHEIVVDAVVEGSAVRVLAGKSAEFGHRDHRNRCMTITWFGHGDRSEATLVGLLDRSILLPAGGPR
jgi:hypothetical protein